MPDKKHTIWSNYNLDFDDWQSDLRQQYPEKSDEQLHQLMYEINGEYLSDERINLNIQLSRPIILIADLGLWNGRFSGYKMIDSGNIRDCLYAQGDYSTWYLDNLGDLRCEDIHHDGRAVPAANSRDRFVQTLCEQARQKRDIAHFTSRAQAIDTSEANPRFATGGSPAQRLGDEIGRVYGWKFPQKQPVKAHER